MSLRDLVKDGEPAPWSNINALSLKLDGELVKQSDFVLVGSSGAISRSHGNIVLGDVTKPGAGLYQINYTGCTTIPVVNVSVQCADGSPPVPSIVANIYDVTLTSCKICTFASATNALVNAQVAVHVSLRST